MRESNIFNKQGYLTDEQRKEKLEHGCNYFTFKTCIDLSEPIYVIPYGDPTEVSLEIYSQDVASFICWWTNIVYKDLNGFSGFSNIKFVPIGFVIV